MTFRELQDAVLGRRFPPASQRENSKRWLQTAYMDVWAAYDWTFKRVSRADVTLAADGVVTMPSDFGQEIALYADDGLRLPQLSQELYETVFDVLEFGSAFGWMAVNRQITVSPAPAAGTVYQLSYHRRLAHKDSGGSVVAGEMSVDSDEPLWDDHHALLVPRATVIGLIELNDPSWQPFQDEYERQLARMREDYETRRPALQWGALSWDA